MFVRRAHRAFADRDAAGLGAAAEVELASRVAAEQRAALLSVGSSLLRAAAAMAGPAELEGVQWGRSALGDLTPRSSVFGAIGAAFGVDEVAVAQAHVYVVLAGMVAAAVRLGRVSSFDGQAVLRGALTAPVEGGDGGSDGAGVTASWGLFSPLLDVAAMRHEQIEPRLFAS
jgi:urease accessory protein UreF